MGTMEHITHITTTLDPIQYLSLSNHPLACLPPNTSRLLEPTVTLLQPVYIKVVVTIDYEPRWELRLSVYVGAFTSLRHSLRVLDQIAASSCYPSHSSDSFKVDVTDCLLAVWKYPICARHHPLSSHNFCPA
jgi:hypothetical protein